MRVIIKIHVYIMFKSYVQHDDKKHVCHQETSTQTIASLGIHTKSKSYCESLISTLLETDTYRFAKAIDSLHETQLDETQNVQKKVQKAAKHVDILSDIYSEESQSSYKSLPKENKLLMSSSRVRTCFKRISPLIKETKLKTRTPNDNISPRKDSPVNKRKDIPIIEGSTNIKFSEKNLLKMIEEACNAKRENIAQLEAKKNKLAETVRVLNVLMGDINTLDEENIKDLTNSKRSLKLELEKLEHDNKELKIDCKSYQEILKDRHPTRSLFSMIRSGLIEEYHAKKSAYSCNEHSSNKYV